MSKIVYILDKIVWLLIVAVLTAQALQVAGIVDTPKALGLGEITYSEGKEYNYEMSAGDARGKRQAGDRSPLIDNIFNIPIATLNAVSDLVQSSRPVFQRIRDAAQRRIDREVTNSREQRASKLKEGPKVQADGSSSRVLLNV